MDWLTNIGLTLSGLPWWAAAVIALITVVATKGVDAALKWRAANLEERKYGDGEAKMAREALVQELKKQVQSLCEEVNELSKKLEASNAAHAKCEVAQATLQGKLDAQAERMNAMQIQINSLLKHDAANKENTKQLAAIVKERTGEAPTIDQVP